MSELAGPVSPEEIGQTLDTDEIGFGSRMTPGVRQAILAVSDADRTVASRDGEDIVGVAVSAPATMTLPGRLVVPVAAVVGVAVLPTHRRQGRLRAMMRNQLDDLRRRGETLAVLTSSEAAIYQRFGYGPATLASWYSIDSRTLSVDPPAGGAFSGERPGVAASARVRLVDRGVALRSFPGVLDSYQPTRAGEVSRLGPGWLSVLGEETSEEQRARFFVLYEEAGEALGYAAYRKLTREGSVRERVLKLDELCCTSPAAYRSLWSYLVDVDLVDVIETDQRPIDEPIRWALSDYRRMRVSWTSEHTYVRLVDVGAALAARRYNADGVLSLRVADPFAPWNEGTYRVVVGAGGLADVSFEPGSGSGERSGSADLAMDVSVLGSVYLGGLLPSALAEVGLIEEVTSGALEVADRMLAGLRPPYCTTSF